ncbi:hypothetical protein HPB49_008118 [Dermacentor silvarum]|uniref:Uncharacterized protein n=1 Tax=Dermacentor silvarum TaxID=543639 RepID=A0ACB8CDW0_DERSI|nr:hypothetical protein HPB49_008118 [Dermacentor silvarum]
MPYEVTGREIAPSEVSVSNGWCDIAPRRTTKPNLNVATNVAAYGATTKASKPVSACKEIIKASRMPLLPQNETKVVIRIRGGLNIAKTGHVEIVQAIQEAAGLETTQCNGDTICPNLKENIMVAAIAAKKIRDKATSLLRHNGADAAQLPDGQREHRGRSRSRGSSGSRSASRGRRSRSRTSGSRDRSTSGVRFAPPAGANSWAQRVKATTGCQASAKAGTLPTNRGPLRDQSQSDYPSVAESETASQTPPAGTPATKKRKAKTTEGDTPANDIDGKLDKILSTLGQLQFDVESLKKGHDRLVEAVDGLTSRVEVMERGFGARIEALDRTVLVVCNPANTIALVCSKYAPSIPKENFSALTRLDHNRAKMQACNIAQKLKVTAGDVRNVIIWGNHSSTQFPDASHASVSINGRSVKVTDAIKDEAYFQGEFLTMVQERGTEVYEARKLTSAMSAAKAAADHVHDWWHGTPEGEWVSMAVMSDGSYGSPADVVFSYPVQIDAHRHWHIVDGLSMSDFARGQARGLWQGPCR